MQAVVALLLALAASPATGAGTVRHSGEVVVLDRAAGTMVLGEVGPWRVKDGATVITRVTVTLASSTEFARLARDRNAPSGFLFDYVAAPAARDDVKVGDFVTVECRREEGRLVALRVVLPRVGGQ